MQSGLELQWLAVSQTRMVGYLMLALPFLFTLIACVLAYLSRDAAAGASIGVISGTWASLGIAQILSRPGSQSGAAGLMLLGAGTVLALSAIAVSLGKPLPGAIFAIAAVRFILSGVFQLSSDAAARDAAGVVGLVAVALAAYGVIAFELEDQRHRAVLPTFRRGRALAAINASPAESVDEAVHEAGVRNML